MTVLTVWVVQSNTRLEITEYRVSSSKIPEAFDGFRIAQVSDLHNTEFGEENSKLLELLCQTDPDVIGGQFRLYYVKKVAILPKNVAMEKTANWSKKVYHIFHCCRRSL